MNEVEKLTALVQWYSSQLQGRDLAMGKMAVENQELRRRIAEIDAPQKEAET